MTILTAIFLAVFLTMIIVDIPTDLGGDSSVPRFQLQLEARINEAVMKRVYRGLIATDASGEPLPSEVEAMVQRLRSDAGLHLAPVPRYLLWTYKTLTFSWGSLTPSTSPRLVLRTVNEPGNSPRLS